jgi:hypothetical protein
MNILGGSTEVDFIADPHMLVNCHPKFEDMFDGIQDLRVLQEEAAAYSSTLRAAGMSATGNMMRVACMPHELLCAIWEVNPGFLRDRKEFYKWLQRHPYYRVGRSVRVGVG